jgi:cytochrome c oxidase subunit 2
VNDLLLAILALPPEGSTTSVAVDRLHFLVISVTMVSAAGVFLATAWLTIRYRRRPGVTTTPRIVAGVFSELVIVIGILSLFISFWVIGYRQYTRMVTPPEGALTVYVTAKQWMWTFSYPSGEASIEKLVVPAGRPVKLAMTSRDVIHSFYVPAFRLKQDVLPGRYVTTWFQARAPGEYGIFCAEYCGVSHSRMLGTVVVLSEEDYARWTEKSSELRTQEADLARRGWDVAARHACFNCHTLDGQPHIGPSWAALYDSWVKLEGGRAVLADEGYLTRSMMEPGADVVEGFRNVMPTYQGLLSEPDTAALVELIRSVRQHPVPSGVALPATNLRGEPTP